MGRGEESEIQELPDDFARWGVPVVLAGGGVGHPDHLRQAAELGADAVLVKSFLFDNGAPPPDVVLVALALAVWRCRTWRRRRDANRIEPFPSAGRVHTRKQAERRAGTLLVGFCEG